ncbi:pentatricopeptide repeat-containing protein At2g30780-like [Impatiens glandulifera]|uniref:pentatricopeptide repeat-containing protein At2g30780-like n=1 Tax=Impatiens glandulifera TaxID=253017 RepID=UPI001FB12037|nr:pentatricopeptide repeat-containing protein At2g30780-like [Impatiens glandulifera]
MTVVAYRRCLSAGTMYILSGHRRLSLIPARDYSQSAIRRYSITSTSSLRSSSSSSSSLLSRLLREPDSQVKSVLDLEVSNNASLKTLGFSLDCLLDSLNNFSRRKAQLVLEWRLEKMLNSNEKDYERYSELLHMCGRIKNVPFALQAFSSMEIQGIKPTSASFNALISACLASGNSLTAQSLFEIMESSDYYKPNSETFNIFVAVYAHSENEQLMLTWQSARIAAGLSNNTETYESLISGYVKSKNLTAADRSYEEMFLSNVAPNISILENMFSVFYCQRNLVKAKEHLKYVMSNGWKLTPFMAEKLVSLYEEVGRVEDIEELLTTTLAKSCEDRNVLMTVQFGVIRMYAKMDRLDDLECSVNKMLSQGISFASDEDVNKVIKAYFRRAAFDRLDLFLDCIKPSYKLTRSTYEVLNAGYKRVGLVCKID